MGIFSKLFRNTKSKETVSTGTAPIFYGKQHDGSTTYEIFRGSDAEAAKAFLMTRTVGQPNYYVVVETPDGNWGIDSKGLYLEHLLSWQVRLDLAKCEGVAQPYNVFSLEMAARRVNDNFLASIVCGKCGKQWIDGIQYENDTVVRCPSCRVHNKINSRPIEVVFTGSDGRTAKESGTGGVADLAAELVSIGGKGAFEDGSPYRQRVLESGRELDREGGIELMRSAWAVVRNDLAYGPARQLERAWHGIGDWMM